MDDWYTRDNVFHHFAFALNPLHGSSSASTQIYLKILIESVNRFILEAQILENIVCFTSYV